MVVEACALMVSSDVCKNPVLLHCSDIDGDEGVNIEVVMIWF